MIVYASVARQDGVEAMWKKLYAKLPAHRARQDKRMLRSVAGILLRCQGRFVVLELSQVQTESGSRLASKCSGLLTYRNRDKVLSWSVDCYLIARKRASTRGLRLLRRLYGAFAAPLQQKTIPPLGIPRRHRFLQFSRILRSF